MLASWTQILAASWAGSIPTWLLLAVAAAAAWSFRRGGGSTAIRSLEDSGRVLEQRVKDLEQEGKAKDRVIATLQAKTDVALAIAPVLAWAEGHELRAQERHDASMRAHKQASDATLSILKLIADQLPPDPRGG